MSGQISSPWLSQNELYYPKFANQQLAEGEQKYAQNQLAMQTTQQSLGEHEQEMMARAASGLLTIPDETARAAAYSGAVADLQRYGFAKNAPSVYPGEAALRRVAQMGVSAAEQYKLGAAAGGVDAYGRTLGIGGTPTTGTGTATGGTGGRALAPVDTGTIEPEAQTRAFAVRDGLIKRGLDPETATAFAANALHESSAKPGTGPGDAGASHGLFQWRDDRYQNYVKTYGHAPDNAPLDEQLDFVMRELGGPEGVAKSRILGAKGVAEKAGQVSEAYLRPKDTVGEMNRRSGTALKLAGLNVPPSPDAQAGMTDQEWLDAQAKTYPSLAGPNVNMQAGTQPPAAASPAPVGVAARTGGVDVASVAPMAPSTPPAAAVTAPANRLAPTQLQPPAVTPAAPAPAPPAQPAAAAAMPPELQTDPQSGLTPRDVQQLEPLFAAARRGAIPLATLQNEAQQRVATNVARQDHWQAQQHQAMEDARQREADARAQQAAQRAEADAAAKAAEREQAAKEPLFHGQGADIQDFHILRYSDPQSDEYRQAYARQATPKVGEGGLIIKPNMEAYRMPLDKDGQPVTTLDQSHITIGPGNLQELRKMETQASGLTAALDDFASTAKKAGVGEKAATLAGMSTDLRSAWTNAGLMAKGEALFNLGVLSGPDMTVIRGALADPSTASGWWASTETIDKQVGRIKRLLETRIDQARRSYGGGMSAGGGPQQSRQSEQTNGGGPKIGATEGGYRFKGGNPGDPASWEKQ